MLERKERIEPFRGLFFNPERCGDLAAIVAPPYDLIGHDRQEQLYQRSPYNVVRLELGRETDRYAAAAAILKQWLGEGILQRAGAPAIHLYTQTFSFEGRDYIRNGFIVTLRLEEFAKGRILPHERTFAAAKQDRLQLLSATQVNLSSIFGLYPGEHPELESLQERSSGCAPLLAVRDDLGIANELRTIEDPGEIRVVQKALSNVRLLIADGHHRYETALNYRRNRRAAEHDPAGLKPYDYVMITLTSCSDPGLLILPTHRVVRRIEPEALRDFDGRAAALFTIEDVSDPDRFLERLKDGGSGVLGVALGGDPKLRLLRLKDPSVMAAVAPGMAPEVRQLDVSILHVLVFERLLGIGEPAVKSGALIDYTVDAHAALASVRDRTAAGAFLMNPPSIANVERVSDAGATMPEKSTYFYPKLLTGLVMNPLDE
jgi:uncharacterized protein (DUF1015 family)